MPFSVDVLKIFAFAHLERRWLRRSIGTDRLLLGLVEASVALPDSVAAPILDDLLLSVPARPTRFLPCP